MKPFKTVAFLFLLLITTTTGTAQKNNISVSANGDGKTFEHYWSVCAGAGRANEGTGELKPWSVFFIKEL
jgi:hypothetical protein